MQEKPPTRRNDGVGSPGESLAVAAAAAAGFMAWGLWVNWEHGMGSRVQVVLTQAGIGFVATLGSAELLRRIARFLSGFPACGFLTGILGWCVINALVFLAHFVCGTPEIWKTMLPGMVSGVIFCLTYAYRLNRGPGR